MPFTFADFNLYPSAVANHNHEYKSLLSSVNPSRKSLNLGMVLRTPNTEVNERKNIPYKEARLCKSPEVGMQMRF